MSETTGTSTLNNEIDFKLYADFDVMLPADILAKALWEPESKMWKNFGLKFLNMNEIFNFEFERQNHETIYHYDVRMNSMVGPESAKQRQTHIMKTNTPKNTTRNIKIQTFNFPYCDTFEVHQIWQIDTIDSESCRLRVFSGLMWIDPPMFIIKGHIQSDVETKEKNVDKYLREILPLTKQDLTVL